ncbi:hypothetical protein LCGC14_1204290 [marine sediment metagenome]|uniref:Uncharacterized protein n=1 Tax=marine sediment metagenome TaxID=412755 RepID=A0A0F9LG08_9ZZZZ
MTFTIVTVAEMQFMAGENVDATGDVTANHQFLHDYAAGYLSSLVKFDLIGGWSGLTANIKFLFTEWAARFCGMQLIAYNMAGYTSRVEAEDMINIHVFRMQLIEKILNDSSIQDFQGV